MHVTQEPLEPCQVALTIEVEPDKVAHAADRAYREYARYVNVPGFRKGKAPLTLVRQRISETDVRQRTAELLVEPAYAEALEKNEITPYAPPKLELVQLDLTDKPFIFKALVPLRPQVVLGPYAGLTVERSKYELSEEDVDSQIERLRERSAEYPRVERPAALGDLVVAEVTARVASRPEAAEPRQTMLEIGGDNIPGFDDQVAGMSEGDEKTFSLTYPDDYPETDLAGQPVEFTVAVKEVRERQMPPGDDEFAKKVSGGRIETLEGLKADLRSDMERTLLQSADREMETRLLDQILAGSQVKYPPVLVEAEVDDDVKALMSRLEEEKISLEDYLERAGKTREEVMTELGDAAEKRIRIGLVLGEISEKENLAMTDADLEAAIGERAEQQGTTPAAMRAFLESQNAMGSVRNRAQTKKVLDFLRSASIIKDNVVKAGASAKETKESVPS